MDISKGCSRNPPIDATWTAAFDLVSTVMLEGAAAAAVGV
jgi:hypothetical protein